MADQNLPEVLFVTRHYWPEPIGSAPPITQMAEWMALKGYKVEVITVNPSYPHNYITEPYTDNQRIFEVRNGVVIRRFPTAIPRSRGFLSRIIPEGRFLAQIVIEFLNGHIKRSPIVISLCPSIFGVVAGIMLRRPGGIHTVVVHDIQSGLGSALGSSITKLTMPLLRTLERVCFGLATNLVVLSEGMAHYLRGMGVERPIQLQPPMADIASAELIDLPPTSRGVIVAYSGNFGRKQGLDQLLDAARVVQDLDPEISFVLRGDGSEGSRLKARVQSEGISNVAFIPLAPPEEMWRAAGSAHLHIVPQLPEGADSAIPSKIFTIMGAKRTFVATADSGSTLSELARETQAFTCVPPHQPDKLAQEIIRLANMPSERARLAQNGRSYSLAHADTSVIMADMMRSCGWDVQIS